MSAQASLLFSSRLLSGRLLDSAAEKTPEHVEPESNSSELLDNLSYTKLILDTETLFTTETPEQNATAVEQSQTTKSSLKNLQDKLAQESIDEQAQQLDEINALQTSILIDDDFDFGQLSATAAGAEGTSDPNSGTYKDSFASNAYIESLENNSSLTSVSTIQTSQDQVAQPQTADNIINDRSSTSSANVVDEGEQSGKSLGEIHQSVIEDFRIELTGQIDTPYQLKNLSQDTSYGQISYQEDGQWQYTLDNESDIIQGLGSNDSIIDSINIQTKGGDSFSLNITIHGNNDAAQIHGDNSADIEALSNTDESPRPEIVQGELRVSDSDSNEARMHAEELIEGTYGQVTITESGNWTYSLNSELDAIKSLHADDSLQDFISVKSIDGTNQLLEITIHGTDDKPLLNGTNSEFLLLAETNHTEQKLEIDDPDFGQSHFQAMDNIQGNSGYGTGSIDTHGNWRYEIDTDNPKVQSLSEGQRLYDTFSVATADGTEQTVIIKIMGSDEPRIGSTENIESSISLSSLITHEETKEEQQALDSYLNTAMTSESSHNQNSSTLEDSGTSSEILQQLTLNNQADNSHLI